MFILQFFFERLFVRFEKVYTFALANKEVSKLI